MTTTFETAKVGDRVWSITKGWGKVSKINDDSSYPIVVDYDSGGFDTFTLDGRLSKNHVTQSFFWDEIVIEAPVRPIPNLKVDTKVLVWVRPEVKLKRHFSQFKDGQIVTFECGKTSFTTSGELDLTCWPHWELAE